MAKGLPRSLSRGGFRQPMRKQVIGLENKILTVTSTGAAIGFGTYVMGGFEEGNILFLGAACNISFAGSGSDANLTDTWSGDFGVGTTPADDGTITAGDVDILASTAIGPATSEAIGLTRVTNSTSTIIDNTAGDLEFNLNLLIDAADIVDDTSVNITLGGFFAIAYTVLGDD